ncbi:hypothetical protein HHX48_09695 [Salinimonas sp. HHU 13199]|uniref:TniQ domain-containing protein n=1 Tax=Salinimonas profundi TaxID=2729140 RepID=A0ABR8LPH7_9ALTE|nr:TniQ family protein [Salinimonas profundi]MBD3586009.1 hypothetical protein [Salinimonas profundi]
MRFLIRPFPKRNEHLLAFMMRVSWLNHMRCLQDLLFSCELDTLNCRIAHRKLVTGAFDVDVLAHNLQLDVSLLEDNTVNIAAVKTLAFNQEFPTDMLDFSHPKLCRQCFEEMGYIPFSSAMVPMTVCPKHGCDLTRCWHSGTQLSWGEHDIWSKLVKEPDDCSTASEDAIELSLLIVRLSSGIPNTTLPQPIHLLSLFDLMLLLRFIVKFDPRISGSSRPRHAPKDAWEQAFSLLKEWPASVFPLFLHSETRIIHTHTGHGVRASFRDIYDELYAGPYRNTYAYSCLQKAFEAFIQRPDSTTPLWSPNHKLLPSECIQNMSCKQAMQLLGLREKGLERLIKLGLLSDVSETQSGVRLLRKANVLKFAAEQYHYINLCDLCNIMELSRSSVVQLVKEGLLPSVAQPDDEHRDWLFDTRHISRFIQGLSKGGCRVINNKSVLPHAPMRSLHFKGKSTAVVVSDMLAGKVKFAFYPDKNRPLSLNQFHPLITDEPDFSHLGYLMPKQVTRLLGVNLNAVYDLAKRNYLDSQMIKLPSHSRKICLITAESINAFKAKYVLKPRKRDNLVCISGPKIDGALLNIYRHVHVSEGNNHG